MGAYLWASCSADKLASWRIGGQPVIPSTHGCGPPLSPLQARDRPTSSARVAILGSAFTGAKDSLKQVPEPAHRLPKPEQDAYIERFFGSLKDEEVWCYEHVSLAEAQASIAAWIAWYNEGRPHSALAYLSPREYAVCTGGLQGTAA
jgi:hypothetical protein